ncbi:MAG: hypothetical protein HW400_95 [Candidatus Levybacteria bacterium]|nr:hypothetical protein [Candidatus Levybacteria bacterium]
MTTADLSILIPARNEMFLGKTIENILANIEGNTEVIAVLDGYTVPIPEIPIDLRVTIVDLPKSIGQRAATNVAARLSQAKYLMKCDAHCAFDKGFDIKMMAEIHDDWTMVPLMKNLHAFDWVCPIGHRRYQGPSGPCVECGKPTVKDILWKAKDHPKSTSYCFDSTPHFQYFNEYTKRPGYKDKGDITETMSLQGSCWMLTRDKYWELGVCDEKFGSWGSQGIEVAVKTWLSGGKVMVNKKTWYAHMFRTQGGDFGFPYPISGGDQEKAKNFARDLFFNNNWPKQVHPLSWLVEKFWPVKGWSEEDFTKLKANKFKFSGPSETKPTETEPFDELSAEGIIYSSEPTKGIIFYTDHQASVRVAHRVQGQLKKVSGAKHLPITCASIKKMTFGDRNIHFPHLKKGYLTMLKQILGALEKSQAEIIFFCEQDVLYHPSHFDFVPMKKNIFYYNQNWWRVRTADGLAVHWDDNLTLGLVAYREHLLKFYRQRLLDVAKNGDKNNLELEPGGENLKLAEAWKSQCPNVEIVRGQNFSENKLSLKDFGDKATEKKFTTAIEIPGWGKTKELVRGL